MTRHAPRAASSVSFTDGLNNQTTFFYHVQLTDLEPGTKYFYEVSDGAAHPATAGASFETAPAGRARYRFSSYGDLATPSFIILFHLSGMDRILNNVKHQTTRGFCAWSVQLSCCFCSLNDLQLAGLLFRACHFLARQFDLLHAVLFVTTRLYFCFIVAFFLVGFFSLSGWPYQLLPFLQWRQDLFFSSSQFCLKAPSTSDATGTIVCIQTIDVFCIISNLLSQSSVLRHCYVRG